MQESTVDEAQNLYKQGKRYLDFEQTAAAIDTLRRAVEIDPSLISAWNLLGRAYITLGKIDKALESLRIAIKINPEAIEVLEELGILQFQEKQFKNAAKTLKQYMKLGGRDIAALLALAKSALELNHCKVVLDATSRLLDIDDDFYQAWELRGMCQARKLRYNAACTSLSIAVEINPKAITALNAVGDLCYNAGNYERAVEFYEISLKTKKKQSEIVFRLGISYWFLQRWKDALPQFERYTELVPDDARGWNNVGVAYREKGEVKRAMECYTRALELDPHLEIVRANMETAKHMQVIP